MEKPEMAQARASKPRGRKVLAELSVRRSLDGGHVISHRYEGYQHEPKEVKFGSGQGTAALQHIAKHAGLATKSEAEEPEENEEE